LTLTKTVASSALHLTSPSPLRLQRKPTEKAAGAAKGKPKGVVKKKLQKKAGTQDGGDAPPKPRVHRPRAKSNGMVGWLHRYVKHLHAKH
jgi:hypothetical protein